MALLEWLSLEENSMYKCMQSQVTVFANTKLIYPEKHDDNNIKLHCINQSLCEL